MSLRIRLLFVSLVLLAAGLTAAGLVSYRSLSSFLHQRTDAQLDATVGNVNHMVSTLPADATITRQDLGAAAPGLWVLLRNPDGSTLWQIQGYRWTERPLTPLLPATLPALHAGGYLPSATFSTPAREISGVKFRMMVATMESGQTLIVGASMQEANRTLDRLVMVEEIGGALILVVAAVAGLWLMRLGLRPLVRMEATAETIAEENLAQRLPGDKAKTELGRLARVLNTMLSRLETGVHGTQGVGGTTARIRGAPPSFRRRRVARTSHADRRRASPRRVVPAAR